MTNRDVFLCRDCGDKKDFGRNYEWIIAPKSVGEFGDYAKNIYDRYVICFTK